MKFVTNLLKALVFVAVVANILISYLLYTDIQSLRKEVASSEGSTHIPATIVEVPTAAGENETVDLSSYATKDYVDEQVSSVDTAATTKTTTVVKEVASSEKQTSIIPIGAIFSTQSLDWIDVPGSEFYLDLGADYSSDAVVIWDVFLHEQHGNGLAEARLMDVTHGIIVVNSELNTNNASSTLLTSGVLGIWQGNNLYRVQVRSQKGFPIFFNSGRLKITY